MQMSSNISRILTVPQTGFHIPAKKVQLSDTLRYDLINFIRVNPSLSCTEAARAFRARWVGYKAKYSEEFITEAIKWLSR